MSQTPFMYLKENIDKIKFNCSEVQEKEYRRAFSAVLDKMDKYFIENELYDVVNYQPIVELMLSSKNVFSFNVSQELKKKHWAGVMTRHSTGKRVIGMSEEYMGLGTTTEGVLCHEFIHFLTLGPDVLSYQKDGERFETQLPQRQANLYLSGYRRNLTQRKIDALEAGTALDGGFICEAFTELTKQEIYSEKECYHSYPAQTSLIKLLNNLTGTQINIKDFLRGDLPNYIRILGRKNFEEFNSLCENFQEKYNQNARIDFTSDPDYIKAQDIVCRTILKNIEENPEKYSVEEYIRVATIIMTEAPTANNNPNYERYRSDILRTGNAIVRSQNLTFAQKQKFSDLMKKTIATNVMKKRECYDLPSKDLNFSFKSAENGFQICFKNGAFISSKDFPKHTSYATKFKLGTTEIIVSFVEKGGYKITASGPNVNPSQTITVLPDGKNANKLLILDEKNNEISKLDFKVQERIRNKNISQNINLLSNFEHSAFINKILTETNDIRLYQIKKFTTSDGKEYLVANSNKSSVVYRITENGYEKVDVLSHEKMNENISVYDGENPTNVVTDEVCQRIKLSDGTELVRYFDETNREQVGEIFRDSLNREIVLKAEDITLFDKGNKDLSFLSSSSSGFASQGINRPLPHKDLEAERKAMEEQKKHSETVREKEETEKKQKIEAERKSQNISAEEAAKRDKVISDERARQQRVEKEKSELFDKVEQQARQTGRVNEDFSVESHKVDELGLNIENQTQTHSNGRGR